MNPFNRDLDLLILGEVYTEFNSPTRDIKEGTPYQQNMGGSDIYTAVSAARNGSKTALMSAIGRDPFGKLIRTQLENENINTDYILSTTGYNGIYFASDDAPEEREYLYHRPGSALESFTPNSIDDTLIGSTKIVYSSSEFQSISRACKQSVFKAFYSAHTNDTMVAYDPNLRLHRQSLEATQENLWSILPFVDVMLPSAPSESKAIFGYERAIDIIGFLWDRGINVVAVKTGPDGCMIGYDGKLEEFKSNVDSTQIKSLTLAGSVFNGAFLNHIAKGFDPFSAGRFAIEITDQKIISGSTYNSIVAQKK